MKWIARALAITVLCALALGGTALAALAHPQSLFAYHVEQGRLEQRIVRRSTMCIGFSSLVASNMPQAEAEQILMRDIEGANGGTR